MPWIYGKTVNICGKYTLFRHWLTSPVWHFCCWVVDITTMKGPRQRGVSRGGCISRLQCIHCGILMLTLHWNPVKLCYFTVNLTCLILGDPGADSEGEGKSKRAEKYGMKKSKERWEEPLGIMSYQTSSKRSPPFWLLIGARKLLCFSAQSEAKCFLKRQGQ